MTDLGDVTYILGVNVKRDRSKRTFTMSQPLYIESTLDRFGMTSCAPASTPIPYNTHILPEWCPSTPEAKSTMEKYPYRELVGSLIYLSVMSRPDIAFAVGLLSRYLSNPGLPHWNLAKHVLRYLSSTSQLELELGGNSTTDFNITAFSDSSWADDVDTAKSTAGYLVKLNNSMISWKSYKEPVVALSSAEAEYVALTPAIQELLWLHGLLFELGFNTKETPTIFDDNQSAIAIASNPVHHQRTRHIALRYHFIRDHILKNNVSIQYIHTKLQEADTLTKASSPQRIIQSLGNFRLRN
jgi:hypothetical protein